MKRIMSVMTFAALGLLLSAAHADDRTPSAMLRLSGGSVGAGVGVNWGSGTLTYNGKDYPVSVKGLTLGDVGIKSVDASGKVYGLKSLRDFDGNYTAVGAGLTAAGGGAVAEMENQNGVKVQLVSTSQGVDIGLGAAGVDMNVVR